MHRQLGLTAATVGIIGLIGIAACSDASAADKDLNRDLDLAASPKLSLAPTAGRTDVVSTVERAPEAKPAPRQAQQQTIVRRSPRPAPVAAVAPVTVAPRVATVPVTPAPEPAAVPTRSPAPTAEPIPAPRPTPTRQAEPRGGWKTEGEVFRNAPFPINP